MKRILVCCLLLGALTLQVCAQSNRTIKQLQSRQKALQEQISGTESLLQTTKNDIGSQLDNLRLLTGQIGERRRIIQQLDDDLKTLDRELHSLAFQIKQRNRELERCKDQYASSVRFLQRNRTVHDRLLFILSAENLMQSYRRLRYVAEYASFQQLQGKEIVQKRKQIEQKQAETRQVRAGKEELLQQRRDEAERLQKQEAEQRAAVASLQQKQSALQSELKKRRSEADQLDKQIDRLIQEALEAERRREAAARKKAEAARNKSTGNTAPTSKPMESYRPASGDVALSSDFASNRGKLPMPVTGPYLIVGRFGEYSVPGLRGVRLDSKGIEIQAKPGAEARAVFQGKVAAVFQFNGLYNVLVRHGSYISVYCKLSSVRVKTGDVVSTKQSLGTIAIEHERALLHFQLRKETAKLNPEPWLHR